MPSGLFADTVSAENATIFKADYTLSLQFWKKTFLDCFTWFHNPFAIRLQIRSQRDKFILAYGELIKRPSANPFGA